MATKNNLAVTMFLLLGSALASNVAPFSLASVDVDIKAVSAMEEQEAAEVSVSVAAMEEVFARPEHDHQISMTAISSVLTISQAMAELHKMPNSTEVEEAVASLIGGSSQLSKTSLRANKKKQPSGYSGIDGARHMLNEMIFESMEKYDSEIMKCTDFYAKQCALMEVARGQISAANFVAANSRALILDAQYNINKCEVSIPELKQELKDHNQKCKDELLKLNTRLKIVMGDVAVMVMILKMTDCDAKPAFISTDKLVMLKCKKCMTFNHKALQALVAKLHHPVSLNLMQEQFADMFDKNAPVQSVQLVQTTDSEYQEPIVNKTEYVNPPIPRTPVPGNPCQDPDAGAPSMADKNAAKCTLSAGPNCYKLQGRFLAIMGGIADERDTLMVNIADLEASCKETKETLETVIANDQALLSATQTKLAAATEKESSAGEEARQTAIQNAGYEADLKKQMKTCSTNYIAFETELCALKKIRGELYKLKGSGHSAFFQDCEVSKWDPEECTKVCGGGNQKLVRNVLTPRKGGTLCLPLAAEKKCNLQPCPVDCKLETWTGWSKCSAKCGGGVQQRLRDVKQAMMHGGKPCSSASETKACNIEACEKDCELGPWTQWTTCSKDCNGGTKKREKFVSSKAEGSGTCAGKWDPTRLEYEACNAKRCSHNGTATKTCNTTMDVLLLIDGCPKNLEAGFKEQISTANALVDAFTDVSKPSFSIIMYCGPRTWSGVSQCAGKSTKAVDVEKVCKVKVHQHFDVKATKSDIHNVLNGLKYERGTKLTALALLAAKSELTLGRREETTVAVIFQDGQPLSFRKTRLAARSLRKSARLLFVVVSKFAPLKDIKTWVTRRWEENLVEVATKEELGEAATTTQIVADICPSKIPVIEFSRTSSAEVEVPAR